MLLLFGNKCMGTTCFPSPAVVPPFDFVFFKAQSKDIPSGQIYTISTTRGRRIRSTLNLKSGLKALYQTQISNSTHWTHVKYVLGASNVCIEKCTVVVFGLFHFVCLLLRFLRRYKTLIYILGYQYIKPSFKHPYNIHAVWLIFFPPLSRYGKSSGLSKFFLIISHSESQYQRNSNAMNGNKTCLLYLSPGHLDAFVEEYLYAQK